MLTMLQPNDWSCLPTSAAMILGVEPRIVIDSIGHDGSEIVWPDLPEPHCRKGFHIQEIIDVFTSNLIIPVLIEARPTTLPFNGETLEFMVDEKHAHHVFEEPTERMCEYLRNHMSVLLGTHKDNPTSQHAVAWDMEVCHDPRGSRYEISDFSIEGALVLF